MKEFYLSLLFLTVFVSAVGQDRKLTISGYSEVRFSSAFGSAVDELAAERFEASGGEEELIHSGSQIYFPGFNLNLLSEISPKVYFQGELNFEYFEGKLGVNLFRSYIDYRINNKFNLQAGKFLTPVGYLNRNQRIYGYLNYSVKPRDMVWEEFGFIPSFMLGIQSYGTFISGTTSINYRLAYGQMRECAPFGQELFLTTISNGSHKPGVSGSLDINLPKGDGEILIGVSGYANYSIESVFLAEGTSTNLDDPSNTPMDLSETGFAPYLRFDFPKFQFFGEWHATKFKDNLGTTGRSSYSYNATSLELLYKSEVKGRALYPYARFDIRQVDDDHPYYGLLINENEIAKTYGFNSSEIALGAALDIVSGNRIKLEFGKFLKGPNPGYRIALSTSFAF